MTPTLRGVQKEGPHSRFQYTGTISLGASKQALLVALTGPDRTIAQLQATQKSHQLLTCDLWNLTDDLCL